MSDYGVRCPLCGHKELYWYVQLDTGEESFVCGQCVLSGNDVVRMRAAGFVFLYTTINGVRVQQERAAPSAASELMTVDDFLYESLGYYPAVKGGRREA